MAIRFRRSFRIGPGMRLNVGKRGFSASFGLRGASLTLGSGGIFGNVGAPGTGFSYRTRLSGTRGQQGSQSALQHATDVQIALNADGTVEFKMPDGSEVPKGIESAIKEHQGQVILAWLEDQAGQITDAGESLAKVHLHTPAPDEHQHFRPAVFPTPHPAAPTEKSVGLLGKIMRSRRECIEQKNQQAMAEYRVRLEKWEEEKERFEAAERRRKLVFEELRVTDVDVMHEYLAEVLKSLAWPRETNVSFQLEDGGSTAYIDVDLPEIEDFPTKTARVASRGLRLIVKETSAAQSRKNYMQHVHGVGFRIAGVTFYSLPKVEVVVLSAYSQRPDKKTGHVQDEYLYSVKIPRRDWSRINFSGLASIDVVDALGAFEIRRKMTQTGLFTPIEPFSPPLN